ncbi:MAG: hypothetical protein ABDH32_05750 [Candidatus Caldarchaeales archaeon]
MDENLELKMLRLKKMKKIIASKSSESDVASEEAEVEEALKIVKERLSDRGDEVLEAALKDYPEITKKIVLVLAKKIKNGELMDEINGGELLRLFEKLGMRIKLETSIRYYKKGEYKSLSDLLKE